jgi:hypothetical protein
LAKVNYEVVVERDFGQTGRGAQIATIEQNDDLHENDLGKKSTPVKRKLRGGWGSPLSGEAG